MKVLIAIVDLYQKVSDEKIFYESLIRANPRIDFYYLIHSESQYLLRPANAVPLKLVERLSIPSSEASGLGPEFARLNAARFATDIARATQNSFFDVIDIPLTTEVQQYLKPALKTYGVHYGLVASFLNLPFKNELQSQANASDLQYTISEKWSAKWAQQIKKQVHYIDPLKVCDTPKGSDAKLSNFPIINYFSFGDGKKNCQYFLELLWFLDKRIYGGAKLHGHWSNFEAEQIRVMVRDRGVPAEVYEIPELNKLQDIYANRCVNVCASDLQFNLLALRSIISGCPTIIGQESEVLNFLKKRFPHLPHLVLPTFNTRLINQKASELLRDYDFHREQLRAALDVTDLSISGADLISVYQSGCKLTLPCGNSELLEYRKQISTFNLKPVYVRAFYKVKNHLSMLLRSQELTILGKVKKLIVLFLGALTKVKKHLTQLMIRGLLKVNKLTIYLLKRMVHRQFLLFAWHLKVAITLGKEISCAKLEQRDYLIGLIGRCLIDRVRIFRNLADIDKAAGKDLIWATYQMRIMRWLGHDKFGELDATKQVLIKHGFVNEARLLSIFFEENSSQEQYNYLIDRLKINKRLPELHYKILDDRRTKSEYKCGIIVSLYNAAANLSYFLTDICEQTLVRSGQCEIILIDSASPSNEFQVFLEFMRGRNIEIVFARNESRETVQGAWNRGISISKSKFLTLLGVDEMIRPDALEILSAELDKDPSLDWIGGNTLLAPVDELGQWSADVLLYDRSGYDQDICLLDGSYLSYVGALYRKSIHDRFGFYDSSFMAGGDNEFRFRILPFIKSKTWPETLGMFRDFPGERVTSHPRAEIEDLRGWYLFRTSQGTAYSFQNRSLEDLLKQVVRCFAFRWAFRRHLSTNIDYALNIIMFIELNYDYDVRALKKLMTIAQAELRSLEILSSHSPVIIAAKIISSRIKLKYIGWRISRICIGGKTPTEFTIFNDNRYEQHYYPWN